MKTEVIEVSPTQREIKIEIEGDAVKKVYNKVVQKYARMASVPGFRKGFAPTDVVKARFKEDINNETLRELLPDSVTQAIQDSGLEPIGEPHIHLENQENVKLNGSEAIKLHVHFDVFPIIEKIDYKGLKGIRRVRPIKDEEVEAIIEERLKESAAFEPIENRKSKTGDTLYIDLVGNIIGDDKAQPISASDIELKLGESYIEKSFNENLTGVEQDDVRTFTTEYPADYGSPELAGKRVEYTATVKMLGKVEIPKANDEWAKGLGEEFKSLSDLRKKLQKDLEMMARMEADNRVRDEIVNELIKAHEIEVPKRLIEIQAQNLLNNFIQDMQGRGINPNQVNEDFVKMAYESMKIQAEKDVRGALLLNRVAELEKIDISKEEISEELDKMAKYYGVGIDEIIKSLKNNGGEHGIADRLRSRKSVDFLFEKAKISDGEWIDEAELAAAQAAKEAKPKKTKEKAAAKAADEPKKKGKAKGKE